MIEHDGDVGKLLKTLDDLNIANDTIVLYTTDNGPHMNSWPDGAMTPFRSEKDTNWEGAFRVPAMIRWPGRIKPGTVANDIFGSHDWFPTLLAAAGDADVSNRLLQGWKIGDRTYRVHIDGHNQLPYLTGQADHSARRGSRYASTTGSLYFTSRKRPVRSIFGVNPLPRVEYRCSSISAWTPMNGRR